MNSESSSSDSGGRCFCLQWQAAAMGIDAAYILPSIRFRWLYGCGNFGGPLFTAHLPATMSVVAIVTFDLDRAGRGDWAVLNGCQ